MEKEIKIDVIKATQASLGKYVKKPPLSDKLLMKPPFRFLHDVITAVLKNTGFFEGLFEDEELVSENVKDREAKILFLTKVISVLSFTTGKTLSVKPSKIVAGQEPEKTNELLQCLGQALEQKLSSNDAVTRYKETLKTSRKSESTAKKVTDSKFNKKPNAKEVTKLSSRSSEKLTNQKKELREHSSNRKEDKNVNSLKGSQDKTKKKVSDKTKDQLPEKSESKTTNNQKKSKPKEQPSLDDDFAINEEKNKTILFKTESESSSQVHIKDDTANSDGESLQRMELKDGSPKILLSATDNNPFDSTTSLQSSDNAVDSTPTDHQESRLQDVQKIYHEDSTEFEENTLAGNASAKIERQSSIDHIPASQDLSEIKKSVTVEKSIDPKPINGFVKSVPSYVENEINKQRPASVRPPSSRPGAPRPRDRNEDLLASNDHAPVGKVNIIVENSAVDEEEDSSILIVESHAEGQSEMQTQGKGIEYTSTDHGHLVQQILESQKEFTQNISGKTEIEWEFGAQKAREASGQEIEQIRFSLQALSRAANPLGKLLDHIQEDVEVMRQELQQWIKIYEETTSELIKQKAANEESLLPLRAKIKQLNVDVEDKRDKINDLKSVIHKNSSRISKLLSSGDVQ